MSKYLVTKYTNLLNEFYVNSLYVALMLGYNPKEENIDWLESARKFYEFQEKLKTRYE